MNIPQNLRPTTDRPPKTGDETSIGFHQLAYYLPPRTASIEELAEILGLSPDGVRFYKDSRGLRFVHIAEEEDAGDIAIKAAAKALQDGRIEPESVDMVIFYHCLYSTTLAPSNLVGRIQQELGLTRSIAFSVSDQYCASVNTAIRVARDLIAAGSVDTVLIVGGDSIQRSKSRERRGLTIFSDGGSAAVIKRDCGTNQLIALGNYTDGAFYQHLMWSKEEAENYDTIYFSATARLVRQTLRQCQLRMEDISLIIPHNVNTSSWARLQELLKFEGERFFGENIPRLGHAYCADVIINLSDAITAGRLRKGDYALMLTAGFGASWGCAVIRH